MKSAPIYAIICLMLLTVACSSAGKFITETPPRDAPAAVEYNKEYSFIHIPVSIRLDDIAHLTNNILEGVIYEDTDFEEDNIRMMVQKEASIKIYEEKGKIKTVLPLRATIEYRIGTNKLGFDLYDIRKFNLNGEVILLSDVGLTNWHLNTSTRLQSIIWKENPTMRLMGRDIPITGVITPAVGLLRTAIEQSIDLAIKESLDFKPNILDALETITKPMEMSEEYESWLRLDPVELYSTDAVLKDEMVFFTMGMKCIVETIIGEEPPTLFNRDKIILKPVKNIPENVVTNMVAISTFEDASRILTNNFKGEEYGSGRKKVNVKKVVVYQNNNKLILGLDLNGSVNGTIYLSGYPQYNQVTKEVYFDKLEYVLNTRNVLLRSANWLVSNQILLMIQEKSRYSIEPNLEEGKKSLMQYLSNYSPTPGVLVNGSLDEFEFKNLQLTPSAILAFIKISGNVSIEVNGLE